MKIRWKFWIFEQNPTIVRFYFPDEIDESFGFLTRTNNMCEWIWNMYLKWTVIMMLILLTVTHVVSIVLCYIKYGSFDADHVFHTNFLRCVSVLFFVK